MEVVSGNNVSGFKNVELANSKRLPHNLLSEKEFRFTNAGNTFKLKSTMSCNRSGITYVLICVGCLGEHRENGIRKSKLRDQVRVYRQHEKQPDINN